MAVGESETQCALARQAALADTEERAREWRAAEGVERERFEGTSEVRSLAGCPPPQRDGTQIPDKREPVMTTE